MYEKKIIKSSLCVGSRCSQTQHPKCIIRTGYKLGNMVADHVNTQGTAAKKKKLAASQRVLTTN